jgi:Putative Actinobacterial Holin-X, holin superfamily III
MHRPDPCKRQGASGVTARQSSRNPIEATREIAEHVARLARLELELKSVVLRSQATRLGVGAGLGLLGVLLAPLLIVFLLATVAAVLATVLETWLAILIVTCLLLVVVGGLVGTAAVLISRVRKGGVDGKK